MTQVFLADLSKVRMVTSEASSLFSEEGKIAVNLALLGELNENLTPLPRGIITIHRVKSIPEISPETIARWNNLPAKHPLYKAGLTEFVEFALGSARRTWMAEYMPSSVLQQYHDARQLVVFHELMFRSWEKIDSIVLVGRILDEGNLVIHEFLLAAWTPFENLASTVEYLGIMNCLDQSIGT